MTSKVKLAAWLVIPAKKLTKIRKIEQKIRDTEAKKLAKEKRLRKAKKRRRNK